MLDLTQILPHKLLRKAIKCENFDHNFLPCSHNIRWLRWHYGIYWNVKIGIFATEEIKSYFLIGENSFVRIFLFQKIYFRCEVEMR